MPEMPELPMRGACRCGGIEVEVRAAPIITAACHCTGCRSMSASAYSLSALIPAEGFAVVKGDPVLGGLKGPDIHHHCCPDCMTWMFTRIKGLEAFVNVRPTLFPDHAWAAPFVETMTREKLPWAETPAVHSFEGFPEMEDFARLAKAYAERA